MKKKVIQEMMVLKFVSGTVVSNKSIINKNKASIKHKEFNCISANNNWYKQSFKNFYTSCI